MAAEWWSLFFIFFVFSGFCNAVFNLKISQKNVGDSLVLNCTITSSAPAAKIEWYKNDGLLQNSSTGPAFWLSHVINQVNVSSGGYYSCIASDYNQTQSYQKGMFVNIKGKPLIINEGNSFATTSPQYIYISNNLMLRCYATGKPQVHTFKWFVDRTEIKTDSTRGRTLFRRPNGMDLTVLAVNKHDSGNYTCLAENSLGVDTRTISVTVMEPPSKQYPVLTAQPPEVRAYLGASVNLTCKGTNTDFYHTIPTWHYNNTELDDDENPRIKINEIYFDQEVTHTSPKVTMTLTLYNVTLKDSGEYICQASTGLKKDGNASVYLHVMDKVDPDPPPKRSSKRLIIGISVSIFISTVIIVLIIIWSRERRKRKFPDLKPGPYEYDVFITYNSKNYAWVKANLMPLLEEHGITYSIHYRNFEIGIPYYENMVNSVYKSRVVIVVMSTNYMASSYCREELDYAIHRSIEEHGRTSPLIIIRIDGIKKSRLPRVVRHKTFVDYASKEEKDLWQRRVLNHIYMMEGGVEDVNDNREDAVMPQEDRKGEEDKLMGEHARTLWV